MSYDLRIVSTSEPDTSAVSEFLSKRSANDRFRIDGCLKAGSGNVVVSKEKRGEFVPVFMLDGAFRIEVEDVDDSLVGRVLAPQWLIEINVPSASSQSELRLARSLGVYLSKAFQGAMYDPQEDDVVWPKKRPKHYKTPQGAESISVVNLCWYLPYAKRDRRTARLFVEVAQRHLYECLPRRYGLFEPFQGKVEDGDYGGFYALWDEAAAAPFGDMVHFACSAPCYGGSVSFSDPRDDMPRNVDAAKRVKLQVDIDGRALQDPAWRQATVALFQSLARATGSFYAIAYVETGVEAKGRSLYFTGESETYPLPRHNRWLGIPAVPSWLTWFGRPYADLVQSACESHITSRFEEGFLLRASDEPLGIRALPQNFPEIAVELQAKMSEHSLAGHRANFFGPVVKPTDDRMTDKPADFIPPLDRD
ncbi:MAG: hypothetical protein AAFN50_02160 [Pseudomonadota bacterium]